MKFLVTGSAGFIGSHVVQHLVAQGHDVVGIDDLNDAYDPALKAWRLARLRALPRFVFHRFDFRDRESLAAVFDGAGLDCIFHLGARAGVRQSLLDPWTYLRTNAEATVNLLELSRAHDVERLVLSSTSSLYGAHNPRPFREDANTDRPLSPYAASKKAAESMCASYSHLYGLHTPILRYFTVYGPAGRPDMSIFRFIRWIAEEEPITLYGDGSQERDFTFVEDIASGTIAAQKLTGCEVVNLGSDAPHKLSEVISLIETRLGKKARVERRPMHPADVTATWADIGKAKRLLGWEPKTTLAEGIARAVDWYVENRDWAAKLDCGEL